MDEWECVSAPSLRLGALIRDVSDEVKKKRGSVKVSVCSIIILREC